MPANDWLLFVGDGTDPLQVADPNNWKSPCNCRIHLTVNTGTFQLVNPSECIVRYFDGSHWCPIICPCVCDEPYILDEETGLCILEAECNLTGLSEVVLNWHPFSDINGLCNPSGGIDQFFVPGIYNRVPVVNAPVPLGNLGQGATLTYFVYPTGCFKVIHVENNRIESGTNLIITSSGSLFTNGVYSNIPLANVLGIGNGAFATITVGGGQIILATINPSTSVDSIFGTGENYNELDTFTIHYALLGGTALSTNCLLTIPLGGIIFADDYGTDYDLGFICVPTTFLGPRFNGTLGTLPPCGTVYSSLSFRVSKLTECNSVILVSGDHNSKFSANGALIYPDISLLQKPIMGFNCAGVTTSNLSTQFSQQYLFKEGPITTIMQSGTSACTTKFLNFPSQNSFLGFGLPINWPLGQPTTVNANINALQITGITPSLVPTGVLQQNLICWNAGSIYKIDSTVGYPCSASGTNRYIKVAGGTGSDATAPNTSPLWELYNYPNPITCSAWGAGLTYNSPPNYLNFNPNGFYNSGQPNSTKRVYSNGSTWECIRPLASPFGGLGKKISTINITNGGTGYVNGVYPNVILSNVISSGTEAVANVTIALGSVTSVQILTTILYINVSVCGMGYDTISGLGGTGVYTNVTLSSLTGLGTGAIATITLSGGIICDVNITTQGSGYLYGDRLTPFGLIPASGNNWSTFFEQAEFTVLSQGTGQNYNVLDTLSLPVSFTFTTQCIFEVATTTPILSPELDTSSIGDWQLFEVCSFPGSRMNRAGIWMPSTLSLGPLGIILAGMGYLPNLVNVPNVQITSISPSAGAGALVSISTNNIGQITAVNVTSTGNNLYPASGANYQIVANANTGFPSLQCTLVDIDNAEINTCFFIDGNFDDTYFLGTSGDDTVEIQIDGQSIVQINGNDGLTELYRNWYIFPISLTPGLHYIKLIGKSFASAKTVALDIYNMGDITAPTCLQPTGYTSAIDKFIGELMKPSDISTNNQGTTSTQLTTTQFGQDNPYLVWSTENAIGELTPNVNDENNYICPDGTVPFACGETQWCSPYICEGELIDELTEINIWVDSSGSMAASLQAIFNWYKTDFAPCLLTEVYNNDVTLFHTRVRFVYFNGTRPNPFPPTNFLTPYPQSAHIPERFVKGLATDRNFQRPVDTTVVRVINMTFADESDVYGYGMANPTSFDASAQPNVQWLADVTAFRLLLNLDPVITGYDIKAINFVVHSPPPNMPYPMYVNNELIGNCPQYYTLCQALVINSGVYNPYPPTFLYPNSPSNVSDFYMVPQGNSVGLQRNVLAQGADYYYGPVVEQALSNLNINTPCY